LGEVVVARLRLVRAPKPRIGLVLGAGGVLGAAWTAGALVALQERVSVPLGAVDVLVGTSAGSILAAALRCGLAVDEIVEHQRGSHVPELPGLHELEADSRPLPPLPRLRIGSPGLLARGALAPHRIPPWVAASALVLQGRGQLRYLGELVDAMVARDGGLVSSWPARGETWIMAVDYASGLRCAFGHEGAPPASLADAVIASCSIPGWYEPKTIDGRRYVDGGVCSSTSLDLLAKQELDEVYVLAPMASKVIDNPVNPGARLERMLRRVMTIALGREVRKVRATGTRVTVLTPGPEDLSAIGGNLMNPAARRRVLETSLLTSAAALAARRPAGTDRAAA
jgi:NTE family protein